VQFAAIHSRQQFKDNAPVPGDKDKLLARLHEFMLQLAKGCVACFLNHDEHWETHVFRDCKSREGYVHQFDTPPDVCSQCACPKEVRSRLPTIVVWPYSSLGQLSGCARDQVLSTPVRSEPIPVLSHSRRSLSTFAHHYIHSNPLLPSRPTTRLPPRHFPISCMGIPKDP
jgi:hypothetical protein